MSDVALAAAGRSSRARAAGRILVTAAMMAISAQGAMNVGQNLASLETGAQQLMTIAQFGYAFLGVVALAAMWRFNRRLAGGLAVAWSLLFVAAVALIPLAWVPDEIDLSLRFAAAAVGLAVPLSLALWASAR